MGRWSRPFAWFPNVLAFVITVVVGIACGCLYSASETLDDKLKSRRHHSAKPPERVV